MTASYLPWLGEPETMPDLVEPIVGYRWFRPVYQLGDPRRTPMLTSVIFRNSWRPGAVEQARHEGTAVTGAAYHPAPEPGCECGIYATREPDLGFTGGGGSPTFMIAGTVELFGRVIIHERGYRSQFARLRSLLVPTPGHVVKLRDLARAYGVPVVVDERLREEVSDHAESYAQATQQLAVALSATAQQLQDSFGKLLAKIPIPPLPSAGEEDV